MTDDRVRQIAEAVLYEGYLLWPYRRSALKNQQRYTFGGVYPEAFARAGTDRSAIAMECLFEVGDGAHVEVAVRCLHLVDRRPARRTGDRLEPIDEVEVDGRRHVAWEEAVEREATTGQLALDELRAGRKLPVEVAADEAVEPLGHGAALVRRWQPLRGELAVGAAPVGDGAFRLSVAFANRSAWPGTARPEALKRSFLSTHLVARGEGAEFVSCTDPPPALADAARTCRNEGVWPVLAGDEERRDVVLGSPIILPDHPAVAPESPGDTFDGGEIDALLIHSIRGLTDAERDEARATDPRARELLDRSLDLPPERMLDLYGAVREMRRVDT